MSSVHEGGIPGIHATFVGFANPHLAAQIQARGGQYSKTFGQKVNLVITFDKDTKSVHLQRAVERGIDVVDAPTFAKEHGLTLRAPVVAPSAASAADSTEQTTSSQRLLAIRLSPEGAAEILRVLDKHRAMGVL